MFLVLKCLLFEYRKMINEKDSSRVYMTRYYTDNTS